MSLEKLIGLAGRGHRKSWSKAPFPSQNRAGENSEHSEQARLVKFLDSLGILYFAVPSGEFRHIAIANRLKLEGVKRGVPDLVILEPRGIYHGLLLEMKKSESRPKNLPLWGKGSDPESWKSSGLSDEQWEFLKSASKKGYLVRVGYGEIHAMEIVEEYLKL